MLLSLFLTCFVGLCGTTVLLLLFGHRVRISSRSLGALLALVVVVIAGEIVAWVWQLRSADVERGQAVLLAVALVVVALRPRWNPVGQVFFASFVASVLAYLAFATGITLASGVPVAGAVGSALLLVLELIALTLSTSFAFESCDVIGRTGTTRPRPQSDPAYQPKVSLQIAAYNEPPDMLIQTIASVETLDYPNFEIVVIDNNTKGSRRLAPGGGVLPRSAESEVRARGPVARLQVRGIEPGPHRLHRPKCRVGRRDRRRLPRRSRLSEVPRRLLRRSPARLSQTPQDYRDYEGDTYLTACYDAYKYFFATSTPSRNERNSIIFAGTMGLLRRSALERLGGWDEWCITEDAETSLRLLKLGYSGLFVPRPFGRGIMPLTLASLKSQRFRWCFGGMQILRKHWRDLIPGEATRTTS